MTRRYNSSAPSRRHIIKGLLTTGLALPYVAQRRLKVIAQVSPRRLDTLAAVPTLAEQGLGDLTVNMFLPLYGRPSMAAESSAAIA